MSTNIETIYQQHIKSLSQAEKLSLMEKLAEELAENGKETDPARTRSIMELHGLGAEVWEGIDPDKYVNELRNEWEHRP